MMTRLVLFTIIAITVLGAFMFVKYRPFISEDTLEENMPIYQYSSRN
ncbi:MAG TPA: hypothetical protein ACFYEF_11645 [Candidatus Wunengus sp. YC63]